MKAIVVTPGIIGASLIDVKEPQVSTPEIKSTGSVYLRN